MTATNNAASTTANGLFLLSQAYHELTKREEQAHAGNASANPNPINSISQSNGKRSILKTQVLRHVSFHAII